jgi:hypothetical protein
MPKKIPDKSTQCTFCKRYYRLPCENDKHAGKCMNYLWLRGSKKKKK